MRVTLHADYGLRVLVYLAASAGRVVPTTEIGRAYGISKNHLVRVAQSLRDAGFIELLPGRTGGIRLARSAGEIRVGDVARALEPDFRLVECFDAHTSTCPISPVCALARVIDGALAAFLAELDRFTIADVVAGSGPRLAAHFLPVTALVQKREGAGARPAAPARRPAGGFARRNTR
ncbi:MAG: Rrf2 family transcriptional regulator [Polyangiaceae bacterium]